MASASVDAIDYKSAVSAEKQKQLLADEDAQKKAAYTGRGQFGREPIARMPESRGGTKMSLTSDGGKPAMEVSSDKSITVTASPVPGANTDIVIDHNTNEVEITSTDPLDVSAPGISPTAQSAGLPWGWILLGVAGLWWIKGK